MKEITIYREFTFDSAHFLSKVPENHKCRNVHGHTYTLKVYLKGPINAQGWLIDFGELKKSCSQVISHLDHQLLNDLDGLQNPTCELLAVYLWNKIKLRHPELCRIELKETGSSGVIYEG